MIADIMFILFFLIFMIGIMLVKTTERKLSFCKQLIIAIWTVISIGAVLAFIMNIVHIPIMLSTMTGAYGICAILVWVYLLIGRKQRIQRLVFVWSDFFSIVFCILIWGVVFFKVFGFNLTISYNGVDAGTHYRLAIQLLNSHTLGRMYFAPLYNSLVMEMFQPFLIWETLYKAFILSDASLNLLNIIMFYVLASEFMKSRFTKVSIQFIIVFYFLGWPVWSWIAGGFVYFGAGVTAYMYGIYILYQFYKCQGTSFKLYYAVLVLVSTFCITECYLLFSPIFLLMIIAFMIYILREKITKKLVLQFSVAVGGVGVIVFCLVFWGYFGGKASSIFRSLRLEGGVHRELYKDFMFLIPINIYMCVVKHQEKRNDLLTFAIISQLAAVIVALVGNMSGFISDYYYFKLYYLGWALQFVGVVQAVDYFWEERRPIIYFCILPIVIVAVLETTGLSRKIIWSDSGNSEMFPVITQSRVYIDVAHNIRKERKENMITAYKWINQNLAGEEVPIITTFDDTQVGWYLAIVGGKAQYIDQQDVTAKERLDHILESFKDSGKHYFTMMQDIDLYVEQRDWFEQFEKMYDDGYYGVYKIM